MKTTNDLKASKRVTSDKMRIGQRGFYVWPAIPPWCREKRWAATLIEVYPDGSVLLRDNTQPNYLIHTSPDSFVL